MILSCIAALDEEMAIGKDNALPWYLPADLRMYRAHTMGKAMIMGRRTYESVGRPLPGRTSIVVTHDVHFAAPGCIIVHTLDDALAVAKKDSLERGTDEIMIIGGAGIFNELLPRADRMYLTVVHGTFSGDTFFPGFDENQWRVTRTESAPADEKNTHAITLYVLDRTAEKPLTVYPHKEPANLPEILQSSGSQ